MIQKQKMNQERVKRTLGGGSFLIEETLYTDVFTPEDFSEEQLMMAGATTDFVEQEVWPNKQRMERKDFDLTLELMKKAGALGLLGIYVPQKYGGLGMGFNTSMLICDRISGASGSLSTAYGAHTGIGILPILLYGTEAQRSTYLPKLASGEWIGAYCLTEAGAGSDANSGKTRAVPSADGKSYSITGQKMWISNAGYAQLFVVFARIEDDENISAFIIEEGTEGLSLGEEEHKMGLAASSTRQVFLNEVVVPAENMLGERNGGFKIAVNALNVGRIKLAAAVLDANRRGITESVKYASARKQFNKSLSEFGAIQQKLGRMMTLHWVSESACYRAGQAIEDHIARLSKDGLGLQESKLKGAEEFAIECAVLKVHASEAGSVIVDEAVQIFGGMGYSADAPMESAYRDIRISRIYEGTNEINRMLIVGMLLKKAMKGQLDLMGPALKVGQELMEIPSFEELDADTPFAEEKEALERLKKAFLMVAGKAFEHFAMALEEEQEILMGAADMVMEIYHLESALLRAEKLQATSKDGRAEQAARIVRLYMYEAQERTARSGREAIYSFTEGDEQRMLLMGLKRFTKLRNPFNIKEERRKVSQVLLEEGRCPF
jgi:alkylation response protein AidB-like acyl-CoA dehydrogenase